MEYILHILILIGIYVILSESLNLIAGYSGLLSISHAAFYGVGAYSAALLAVHIQTPFLLNLLFAIFVSFLLGLVVSIPTIRLRDDYFVIATFALQVIAYGILNNWVSLTGGPLGISGIPQPSVLGFQITSRLGYLFLVGLLTIVILWITISIDKSQYGRVLKAIREDEEFASANGKNVFKFRVVVFTLGAVFASIAGVLYAYFISYIDPTSFTVMESIFIISIVIIGGAGSVWGPIVGAVILVTLPEILRFLGMPSIIAANVRQIIYGGALVAFMFWRPRGLVGNYSFQKEGVKE